MGIQVREFRQKVDDIKRFLGYTTNKQLAAHFHVDTARVTQWHGEGGIPEPDLRSLAQLLNLPYENLRDWPAAELHEWLDINQPGAVLFRRAIERARDGLIRIVQLNRHALGAQSDRGVQRKSAAQGAPPIEELPARAETLMEIELPWQQLGNPARAAVLLLHSDDAGTSLLTRSPLVVGEERARMRLPEQGETDPFVFTSPYGRQCVYVFVTSRPLPGLVASLAEVLSGSDARLSNRQLNLLGRTVDSGDAHEWVIGKKDFYVTRE
jgi:hypothetical protein